jgi:hypothetical protein
MNPKHYEGKPCVKCGGTLWYASIRACVSCKMAYYKANQDKVKARRRAHWAEHKDEVEMKERRKAYYMAHKEEDNARTAAYRKSHKPEIVAEKYLHDAIASRGGLCPKFIDPARRGAPDRMVLLPGGRIHFVEMKRSKFGKVAPHQERYHADLRRLGFSVHVLWSVEDVDAFLAAI